MKELRCPHCNRKLLDAEVVKGEIKCSKCGKLIKLEYPKKTKKQQ
ncbi:MAG: Com family DNA-binding transcriptional regulator [Lachnospiraceae bacterium]|nr:Com family DNA-binding transcriptional regulator [Lachnospiraceae bacterium]